MFSLIFLIAVTNFAIGYGLAIYLGWATWPALPGAMNAQNQETKAH